jgi:hypothetical protein
VETYGPVAFLASFRHIALLLPLLIRSFPLLVLAQVRLKIVFIKNYLHWITYTYAHRNLFDDIISNVNVPFRCIFMTNTKSNHKSAYKNRYLT